MGGNDNKICYRGLMLNKGKAITSKEFQDYFKNQTKLNFGFKSFSIQSFGIPSPSFQGVQI